MGSMHRVLMAVAALTMLLALAHAVAIPQPAGASSAADIDDAAPAAATVGAQDDYDDDKTAASNSPGLSDLEQMVADRTAPTPTDEDESTAQDFNGASEESAANAEDEYVESDAGVVIEAAPEDANTNTDTDTDTSTSAEEGDLFEGDIKVTKEVLREAYPDMYPDDDGNNEQRRDAARSPDKAWPGGVVPFQIHSSVGASQGLSYSLGCKSWDPAAAIHRCATGYTRRSSCGCGFMSLGCTYTCKHVISEAIDDWQARTDFQIVARRGESAYVEIRSDDDGCWANSIGYNGGKVTINLQQPGCMHKGIVVHEFGHAIGFWHEQSRPDRDSFVNVHWQNIKANKEHNFAKRSTSEVDSLGVKYDYGSIMHYGLGGFSKNGQNTLSVKNALEYAQQGMPAVGQRLGLSTLDAEQAERLRIKQAQVSSSYRIALTLGSSVYAASGSAHTAKLTGVGVSCDEVVIPRTTTRGEVAVLPLATCRGAGAPSSLKLTAKGTDGLQIVRSSVTDMGTGISRTKYWAGFWLDGKPYDSAATYSNLQHRDSWTLPTELKRYHIEIVTGSHFYAGSGNNHKALLKGSSGTTSCSGSQTPSMGRLSTATLPVMVCNGEVASLVFEAAGTDGLQLQKVTVKDAGSSSHRTLGFNGHWLDGTPYGAPSAYGGKPYSWRWTASFTAL